LRKYHEVLSDIFLADVVCFFGERLLAIICHATLYFDSDFII